MRYWLGSRRPAREAREPPPRLRRDTRIATGDRSQRRWLNGLIVLETPVGLVLLVAATLVITGLDRLTHVDPGFDRGGDDASDVAR